ncbi:MAG: 50S ribosomal protein L25/general stress protein Ctc, partial [Pseudomonadota bacterium]|nr:50S ribosomal protein L25/general stress protein Ctc [Pseudomonadota bacterium]
FNSVVMVEVNGKAVRTLPKDVAFHPVTDRPLHADFLRVSEHATVNVNVPVRFENEDAAPGLKKGGVLNVVRHDVELIVDAANIPEDVVVDLKGFEVGDSIHISAVTLPKGAKTAIDDRDFTIATIVAPSALRSSEGDTTKEDEGEAEAE